MQLQLMDQHQEDGSHQTSPQTYSQNLTIIPLRLQRDRFLKNIGNGLYVFWKVKHLRTACHQDLIYTLTEEGQSIQLFVMLWGEAWQCDSNSTLALFFKVTSLGGTFRHMHHSLIKCCSLLRLMGLRADYAELYIMSVCCLLLPLPVNDPLCRVLSSNRVKTGAPLLYSHYLFQQLNSFLFSFTFC